MGDPRKQRKKYMTPSHPWQGDRIKEEKVLMRAYGLKTKAELWKMSTLLKKIKVQAKELISKENEEKAKKQKELFLKRLLKLGIITTVDIKLEDILGLDVKIMLDRRLQTVFFRKGLAKTITQARQFILHGHVMVNEKRLDVPSYLVPVAEESTIAFIPSSSLDSIDHPERTTKKKPETEKLKSEEEKEFEEVKEAAEIQEKVAEAVEEIAEEEKIAKIEEKVEEEKKEESKESKTQ